MSDCLAGEDITWIGVRFLFDRDGTPGKSSLTFIDHKMVVRHVNKAINALQD